MSATTTQTPELDAAVKRFIARTRTSKRSALEIGDAIVRTQSLIDTLRLDLARDAAHFATTDEWERHGFTTPVAWLTNECHMTPGEAGAAICVGDQANSLQSSVEAMAAGRVGFPHLVLLARTAEAVQESGAQLDELRLLRKAEAQSPHQFRRDCAHARHAADAAAFQRRQQQCADERFLEVRSLGGDDGGVWVKDFIDAVGGATLRAALEPLARRLGADDDRPRGRRLADALVEMAAYTLNTGGQGATHCQVPHLQVTTTLETLTGAPGAPGAEVEGCIPLSTAAVQRLACSANVRRILLGPDSLVVDVGRARRVPVETLRRYSPIQVADLQTMQPEPRGPVTTRVQVPAGGPRTRHYWGLPPKLTGGVDTRRDMQPAALVLAQPTGDGSWHQDRFARDGSFAGKTETVETVRRGSRAQLRATATAA